MSNYLGDNKLRFLQTKYNYGKLDSGRDTCKYDMFYTEAKNILKRNEGLEHDSDKILRALCYVYKNKLSGTLQSNMCNFLYFWLGTILLDKMRNKVVFFDVILNIFNTLKNDNIGKFCNLPHYYINENNFKKIKLFFDYSEDYNSYKQHLNKNNHLCNKKYKTYLETYVNSYKNARDECAENPNRNSYCEEFNQYFKDKDDNLLSKWKCELQEHGKEELELEEEQEEDVAEKSLLSPGHGNGLHTGTIPNEDSSEIRQEENHPGSSVYHSGDGISDLNNISNLPDDSSPSTMKKSITSAVSAAGVLVPPFIIYNYEPARSWINKLLRMNKGTNRNPYANQELMADFSMPEDFYSERNRYNIMYNPE